MHDSSDHNWRSYLLRQRRRRRSEFQDPPKPIVYKRDFTETIPTVVALLMLVPIMGALAMIAFMF